MKRFEGTQSYVATDDLKVAVNAAVMLRRPLLVKGEPGTGKTVLAHEIAEAVGAPLIEWNVKSTTKAQQGLYEYDAVSRLRDSQLGDERVRDIQNYIVKGEPGTGKTVLAYEIAKAVDAELIEWNIKSTTKAQQGLYEYDAVARLRDGQLGEERVHDIRNYIRKGKLWEAFTSPKLPVLLIDEIDKADIEFPNDLLQELDRMAFHVYETDETISARERPIVVITSNNEKELPDAFLRRCFFHYIKFPDRETMQAIIDVHFPGIQKALVREALTIFYDIREVPGLKKKPSTSELLDWLKLLLHEDLDVLQRSQRG